MGRPGTRSPGALKGASVEATRSSTAGAAGGAGNRGDPATHHLHRRKVRDPGRPGEPPVGEPRERTTGATRGIHPRQSRKMRIRGDPETHRESALEGEDSG
jgi:hypothetical protein